MSSIKTYFKSKEFLISFSLIFLLALGSVIDYFICMGNDQLCYHPQWANRFAFWRHTMNYSSGGMIMFLSPFLICILAITQVYYKLKGSAFKDILLRQSYRKTFLKELFFSYLKAYLPFLIVSLLVFLLGSCLYKPEILNINYADTYTEFFYDGNFGPCIYILLWHISLFLYVMMIVNISYIVLRITKKLTVSLILTFAAVNALNYFVSAFSTILEQILGNNPLVEHFTLFNVYEGYYIRTSVMNAMLHTGIVVILTSVVLYFMYRRKEKVVRAFE